MSTSSRPIILYPHEYNLRGGEAKGSVRGITHDGEKVTIKLRITGTVRNADAMPSIAAFAKLSLVESKLSCIASPDNSPESPKGVILFIDCEPEKARDPDPEYSTYYISRWAQILRNGHAVVDGDTGDLPFIGIGRLVIDKNSKVIKEARENIEYLKQNRSSDWESAIERNNAIINNWKSYDYYIYGYQVAQEKIFELNEEDALIQWMDEVMGDSTTNANNGILFRIENAEGRIIKELSNEIFPLYMKTFQRYQTASEIFGFYRRFNSEISALDGIRHRVMPVCRFAGKKIFKDSILNEAMFKKLEDTFYLNGEPLAFPMAVKIDRLENKERLIHRIHLLNGALGHPYALTRSGACALRFEGQEDIPEALTPDNNSLDIVVEGISMNSGLSVCAWHSPGLGVPVSVSLMREEAPLAEVPAESVESAEPLEDQAPVELAAVEDEAEPVQIPPGDPAAESDLGDLFEEAPSGIEEDTGEMEEPKIFGSEKLSFDHFGESHVLKVVEAASRAPVENCEVAESQEDPVTEGAKPEMGKPQEAQVTHEEQQIDPPSADRGEAVAELQIEASSVATETPKPKPKVSGLASFLRERRNN